jgi:hypothetical protein
MSDSFEEEESVTSSRKKSPPTTVSQSPVMWTVQQLIHETARRRSQLDDEKDETKTWFRGPPTREPFSSRTPASGFD